LTAIDEEPDAGNWLTSSDVRNETDLPISSDDPVSRTIADNAMKVC
jgi:hypothetical protein